MKKLDEYIIEKILISKNSDLSKDEPQKEQPKKSKEDDPTQWEVGDILYVHWGYSMSLVDYYEIIRTTGKSIVVKQLKDKVVSGSMQQGYTEPVLGEYENNKEIMCRINRNGYVKIENGYGHPWNGKPMHVDRMD